MITGSVSGYVRAEADFKGAADKFGASGKSSASFSQKRGGDIPSWLQQMKQQEKSSRDTLKLSRATPHKDCARVAPSDFSLDCTNLTQAGWRLSRKICAI